MTVLEISECFPNKYKPFTGEFVLNHARALSKHCNVTLFVPLRFVPPKEIFSLNPLKSISNFFKWLSSILETKNFAEGNLNVVYSGYISLPRPYFEVWDNFFIKHFFIKRSKSVIKKVKPDIIYCHWIRPWSELSSALARQVSVPLIIDHHEDIPTLKKLFPSSFKKFLNSFLKADSIIVHSSLNRKDILDEGFNLKNVRVNYLGQNLNLNHSVKNSNSQKLKLICVSHLYEERKNIDVLIRAAANLKSKIPFQLVIVGDGNLMERYVELAHSLDLKDEVKFPGALSQKEIEEKLNDSDIFVLPSFPEAFGIVFIEALARGVPVITCKGNGGGEELKLLGYPAELVSPHSPEELSQSITQLFQDKEKMSLMSALGKKIVSDNFTWENNAKVTYQILEETITNFNHKN